MCIMTNNQSHNIFQSLLVIGYCIFVIYFTHGQKACSCVASLTPLDKLTEHFFFLMENGKKINMKHCKMTMLIVILIYNVTDTTKKHMTAEMLAVPLIERLQL